MPTSDCSSCGNRYAPHSVIDEHGSAPTCSLCLIATLGGADARGVTVSVLVSHGAGRAEGRPR